MLDSGLLRSRANCMDRGGVKSEFVKPDLSFLSAVKCSMLSELPVLNTDIFNLLSVFGFLLLLLLRVYFKHFPYVSLFPVILCIRYNELFEEDYWKSIHNNKNTFMENVGVVSWEVHNNWKGWLYIQDKNFKGYVWLQEEIITFTLTHSIYVGTLYKYVQFFFFLRLLN